MRSAPNSMRCLLILGSLLLLTLSTACTAGNRPSGTGVVLGRTLPPTPAWAQPVHVSRPADGTDWEVVAKREQNGRLLANGRIVCLVGWIDERRQELAIGQPGAVQPCEVRR